MALSGSTLTQLDELLTADPNVVGYVEHEVETTDGATGVRVYFAEAPPSPPDEIDGFPVDVVVTGRPEKKAGAAAGLKVNPKTKVRPLIGGISISGGGSGTLGYFVTRDNKVCLMSASHVLKPGTEDIIQPSRTDGGTPSDLVAKLAVSIDDGDTGVDAGVATLVSGVGHTLTLNDLGKVTGTGTVKVTDTVKKSGKMTGVTTGTVKAVAATVDFDGVVYKHQIEVVPAGSTPFSIGGDSGSLVVTSDLKAIGLLMGGTNTLDWVNPIDAVLKALKATLAT